MAALGAATALTSAVTAAGPAFAGGGAGMTLTASMSGQKGVLPFGSLHIVWVQVTDSPLGEATLEHVTVTVSGAATPVVCDRGPNGTVVLVPGRTVECSTQIAAGAGPQSLIVQATGVVAGSENTLVRTVVVSYQGAVPTPVPTSTASSLRPVAVRSTSTPGRATSPSAAHAAGCGSSAPSTVIGSGCAGSDKPSMECTSGSPLGSGPGSAGGPGCAPVLPSASPGADCAARGAGPVPLGSEDCAKAKGWGALALTGTQIMGWGAVAVTAVAAGAVLMVRHRRAVR